MTINLLGAMLFPSSLQSVCAVEGEDGAWPGGQSRVFIYILMQGGEEGMRTVLGAKDATAAEALPHI